MHDHDWIERHIPHKGDMCLLDMVQQWDENHIRCRAVSHRDGGNPLRHDNRLGIAAGIEYAAQAMATHGALTAADASSAKAGYLVSVRGVRLAASRLDDIPDDLTVEAHCGTRNGSNVLYQFRVSAGDRLLLEGRAVVVLDAATLGQF